MNTRHPPRGSLRQRGVTLLELMVGITIGLILILAASAVYLYSKKSYGAVTENSQMEENGRFALDLVAKYIQSAGFVMIDPTAPDAQLPLSDKLAGCEFGFANAEAPTSPADLACRGAAPEGLKSASLFTRYETDAYVSSAGKQQGFGCTNEAAGTKQKFGVQSYEARSYVFISHIDVQTPAGTKSMGQLSCASDSTPNVDGVSGASSFQVQPLVPGIEQLGIGYVSSKGALASTPPATPAAWQDITAIELCVLARTVQSSGNDTGTRYTDCDGNAITPGPSESYRTLRMTVALRNTATL